MRSFMVFACGILFNLQAFSQSQYASTVIAFSTEWSPTSWSAQQTLGPPNTTGCGDIATAWASASQDAQREYLVLGFTTPQAVNLINIWETWNPGAIDTLYLRNSSNGVWNVVYTNSAAPALPCPRTLTVTFSTTSYTVDAIRIALNSPVVPSWNEIDAVEIQLNCSTTVNSTNNPLACFGDCNATATANTTGQSPFSYLWSPGAQTTQTATGLCANTYTVTVTDANNCTSTAVVTITEPSQISLITTSTPTCANTCNGSTTVNASGGTPPYQYNWVPGNQTSSTMTGLCAGSYTSIVTDANGCTATSSVIVTANPAINISTTGQPIDCFGNCNGTISAVVSGGCSSSYTYLWMPTMATTSSVSGLCAGTYTVVVTDACGCTETLTLTLTQPPQLVVTAGGTAETCPSCCDGTLSSNVTGGTGPYTYLWTPGNMTTANVSSGVCPGVYTLCVTDANGCSNCDTANAFPNVTGIHPEFANTVNVWPNPSGGIIYLSMNNGNAETKVEIFDMSGRLVYDRLLDLNGTATLDVSALPSGVYDLRVSNIHLEYRTRITRKE